MKVEISRLKKSYGTHTVLCIEQLEIRSGCITAIVGPNGAGKTTLLNLLSGLVQKDEGQILYDGSTEPPYREMTMVFQEPCMIMATVRKNLAWPLKIRGMGREQTERRVEELAQELGLIPLLDRRADRLSAGETQKAALARALSFEPRLLFLDEPGANIDPEATAEIEKLLLKMRKTGQTTIVLVTHNLAQARRLADDILLLDGGRAAESCAAEEFFTNPSSPAAVRLLAAETVTGISGNEMR